MPLPKRVPRGYAIEPLGDVSAADAMQLAALRDRCNSEDELDLKVYVEAGRRPGTADDADIIIVRHAGQIVGCCTLDGYSEIELCGMVAPEHRRRGLGRALLESARAACARRSASRVLLICEDGSAAGRSFLSAAEPRARLDFKELRMELVGPLPPAATSQQGGETGTPAPPGVEVRAVGVEALEVVAQTQAAVFGDNVEGVRWGVAQDMRNPHYRFYLATRSGEPVSSLKVIFIEPRAYIYAFGVVPSARGKGIGAAVLGEVVRRLHTEGWPRIALEVESENGPALALYRRLGFRDVTTYGYYELPLPV
ncbi:MAG TPA: GNAT family N-acetyltransferase [Ktedonobacterales bacterium]|nr:GNAT family N-acetyltransferase [Ktedonobacterales bacterium]